MNSKFTTDQTAIESAIKDVIAAKLDFMKPRVFVDDAADWGNGRRKIAYRRLYQEKTSGRYYTRCGKRGQIKQYVYAVNSEIFDGEPAHTFAARYEKEEQQP